MIKKNNYKNSEKTTRQIRKEKKKKIIYVQMKHSLCQKYEQLLK